MIRKLFKLTQRSSYVNELNHTINHDDKKKNFITSSKDVRVRRDIYVKLKDLMSFNEII